MLSRSLAVRRGRERREDIEGGVERWTESVDLKHYGNKLLQGGRKVFGILADYKKQY